MNEWETKVSLYLQGEASRADVESLRVREDLSDDDRFEIESYLRLVDELASAGKAIVPPLGAELRLIKRLGEHWQAQENEVALPGWKSVGKDYQRNPLYIGP